MNRKQFRAVTLRYIEDPIAKLLSKLGISPNLITVFGLLFSITAALLASMDALRLSGVVFLVAGLMDMLDGTLARHANRTTKTGSLLDSVLDRIGEAALFLGLTIYGVRLYTSESVLALYLTTLLIALVTSQLVSYLRAKGESLGIEMVHGVMTRPERLLCLSLGLILAQPWLSLSLIAILSTLTFLQRFRHIWRNVDTIQSK